MPGRGGGLYAREGGGQLQDEVPISSLCYEGPLKKSGLILLHQRREDACITFLERSYSSSDLLRNLVLQVAHTIPYAL